MLTRRFRCNVLLGIVLFGSAAIVNAGESLFDKSLEELMAIPITSASLTPLREHVRPNTVTVITKEDIRKSGARSLDELLEIYVPNLQFTHHREKLPHLGLRGIISDRDDKYLLVVNGIVMNERTDFGVMSERDLPTLRDIHQIDVIRGPGSAMYGPGALSMVIYITTESAETFTGMEVSQRVGVVERHSTTEFQYGQKLQDGAGFYVYGGYSHYPGISSDDAPMVFGAQGTYQGRTYAWNEPRADAPRISESHAAMVHRHVLVVRRISMAAGGSVGYVLQRSTRWPSCAPPSCSGYHPTALHTLSSLLAQNVVGF